MIALILVIVLPIVLTRKKDDNNTPDNPDVPQPPHGFGNPYQAKISDDTDFSSLSGTLSVRKSITPEKTLFEQFLNEDHVKQMVGVDS